MIQILIRYLGIKTKLLKNIKHQICSISNDGNVVLDLFAGSNVVSQYLSDSRTIYTNDIQKYSYTVAMSTIKIDKNFDYTKIDVDKIVNSKYFIECNNYLNNFFFEAAKYENEIINKCLTDRSYSNLLLFEKIYNNTPYTGHFNRAIKPFENLKEIYNEDFYNALKISKKYMLFSLNYAMPYFTLNQSIFIDSFRGAIQKMWDDHEINNVEYNVYLSLIIFALQNIVTSIGDHFAQPQIFKISKEKKYMKEIDKIINKKNLSIYELIKNKQKEFQNINANEYSEDNKCFNMDAIALIENKKIMDQVDVIYIDPPYTNAHYSRFYHILEILVNYDYPKLEFNGRYSVNRFQSAFCQKTKAAKEFEKMINICSEQNKKLVISYSDTSQCLIDYEIINNICKKHYKKVKVEKINYLYRNLGQKPNKVTGNELLFICEV